MAKFRKKPVVIDAALWVGSAAGATPVIDWVLSSGGTARYSCGADPSPNCPTPGYHATHHYCPSCPFSDAPEKISIDTLEGVITASPGDWIIRGVQGEFYPCKPDIFAATYESAD